MPPAAAEGTVSQDGEVICVRVWQDVRFDFPFEEIVGRLNAVGVPTIPITFRGEPVESDAGRCNT
jgi:hypothetical protein